MGLSRKQDELTDEINFHIDERVDELVDEGHNPQVARKMVLREFGAVGKIEEECREAWGTRILSDLIRDFKLGVRQIKSHPWFSAAVVLILALGIGINTTVFTVTNSMLFKPLSIPNGDRIVVVYNEPVGNDPARRPGESGIWTSHSDFIDYQQQNTTTEMIAGIGRGRFNVGGIENHVERIWFSEATPNLFELVEAQPHLGRFFDESDTEAGSERVVVISHRFWEDRYLSDPDVLGKTIYLDRNPVTIIGVLREGERFPYGDDLVVPLVPRLDNRSRAWARMVALLKPSETIESAQMEFTRIASQLAHAYPVTNKDVGAILKTFSEYQLEGPATQMLFLMMGAVGFVLLIASSNVANLMLSKNLGRRFELSIKASLGATRWQSIRLLLTESILLSVLGGIFGLFIALVGVGLVDRITKSIPDRLYWIDFSMDYTVVGYIVALSLLSGILFGLLPALKGSRNNLHLSLSEGTRASVSKGSGKLSGSLVVFQFAMTFILLFGAGLLVRSFIISKSINEFIPKDEISSIRVWLPSDQGRAYENEQDRMDFASEALGKLRSIPGVSEAVVTSNLPGVGGMNRNIEIDGRPINTNADAFRVSLVSTTPDFLTTINLTLHQGREFNEFDRKDAPAVAIVPRSFADTHWPNESAIGKRFRDLRNKERWYTIIGVCADLRSYRGKFEQRPLLYIPYYQHQWGESLRFMVRSELPLSSLIIPIRSVVEELDPYLPLYDVGTLDQLMDSEYYLIQMLGVIFMIFAALGLVLASVGIYAIVSHSTMQRSKEIGIRLALGATTGRVVRLMLTKGICVLAIGLLMGVFLAPIIAGWMPRELQLQVGYTDPMVYILVSGVLLLVGLLASWLPAWKVARHRPAMVLHRE